MIQVRELKKVYQAKKGKSCVALDGISFTLPAKGTVFVVGKSGSGKSTFLNLLGGLDGASEGDIVVGGKSFSSFTESDYDDYRNSYVGFVFQDFCLLDELTVLENVKLSLDLRGDEADERIREVLGVVELTGFETRYPRELSGGQRQRVALARALVKDPKIILADEPTGNLDRKTAKQVLDFLKILSKERLVVIVSHNAEDADRYADRIIELSDGRVLKDVSRREREDLPLIDGKKINLPFKRRLTERELTEINAAVKQGDVTVSQAAEEFENSEQPTIDDEVTYQPLKKKMKTNAHIRLSAKLSKGNRFQAMVTTLMVSLLIVLLSVCRAFAAFDGKKLIKESVVEANAYSFALYKGYRQDVERAPLITDTQVEVTDEDVQAFYDAGYEGDVYKLYNVTLSLGIKNWNVFEKGEHVDYSKATSPYVDFGSGVLECKKSFLDGLYGNGGGIKIVAGDLSETTPRSLIITDYFADCIRAYYPEYADYQAIVDAVVVGDSFFDVKAIVDTGYKNRHAAVFAEYERVMAMSDKSERKNALKAFKENEGVRAFYEEVKNYLALAYYFGDDYEEQEIAYVQSRGRTCLDNPYFTINGTSYKGSQWGYYPDAKLKKGEIYLPSWMYNELMGTDYSIEQLQTLVPFEITLTDYPYHSDEVAHTYQKTLKVVGIDSYVGLLCSYSDYLELYAAHLHPHALYFSNAESAASAYTSMKSSDFYSNDEYYKTVYTIMDVLTVFGDVFLILYIGLIVVCALILVGFSRRIVKKKMYEIGVLRALGARNGGIAKLFIYDLCLIAVCITVISVVGSIVCEPLLNGLLIDNLAVMLNTAPIARLKVVQFSLWSASIDAVTIGVLSIISSLGVVSSCRKIKPMDIIRNKE